jgi:hypothetical protein
MKKALFVLLALLTDALVSAQQGGSITFGNRNIPTTQPNPALPGYIAGGNGNGTYNVGIYTDGDIMFNGSSAIGAGTLPGGVTVGLYYQDRLLATALLGTTPASAPFFVTPSLQDVIIKDTNDVPLPPGSTALLTVRAWTTASGSFEAAKVSPTGRIGEWTFTSRPLGGTLPNGQQIPVPRMTGWGGPDNGGVDLGPISMWPWPRMILPTNDIVLAASERSTVSAEVVMQSNMGDVILTNLTILANSIVLATHNGPTSRINASTESLPPGTYALRLVSKGYFQSGTATAPYGPHTSAPVNITIIAAAPVTSSNVRVEDGKFRFDYSATSGLKYVLKNSTDLLHWQPIITNTATVSPLTVAYPADNSAPQFFKVDRLPNP